MYTIYPWLWWGIVIIQSVAIFLHLGRILIDADDIGERVVMILIDGFVITFLIFGLT